MEASKKFHLLGENLDEYLVRSEDSIPNLKKYLNKTRKVYHLTSKTQNLELKKFFQDFDCKYYAIKCYTSKMINVDKKKLISFIFS